MEEQSGIEKLKQENKNLKKQLEVTQNTLSLLKEQFSDVERIGKFGTWTNDTVENSTTWSANTYELFGYAPNEDTPENIFAKHIHPDDEAAYWAELKKTFQGGKSVTPEIRFRIRDKHSNLLYLTTKGRFEFDKQGNITNAFGTIQDITRQVLYEESLKVNENKLTQIFNAMPVGVAVFNSQDEVIKHNTRFEELFGYSTREVPNLKAWFRKAYPENIYRKKIEDAWDQAITDYLNTGIFKPVEAEVTCKDRSKRIIEFKFQSIDDINIITFFDLTIRKQTQKALLESEEKYRNLFEKSKDPILLIDGDVFVNCNQAALDMLQMKKTEEIVGRKPQQISPKIQPDGQSSAAKAKKLVREALRKGYVRFEWVHLTAGGSRIYIEVSLTSIPVNGKTYLYVIWRDITLQKEQAIALQKAKELAETERNRFEILLETLPVGVSMIDQTGKILKANAISEEILGIARKEHTRKTLRSRSWKIIQENGDIMKPEDYPASRVLAGEKLVQNVIMGVKKKKSELTWISTSAAALDPKIGGGAAVVYEDITAQLQYSKALAKSEERYHGLFENMNEAFILQEIFYDDKGGNPDFQIIDANPAAERILGAPLKNIMNHTGRELLQKHEYYILEKYARVAETGVPDNFSYYSRRVRKHYEIKCYKVEENRVALIMSDITARTNAEINLKQSEYRYRSLIAALSEGIVMQSVSGDIIAANKSAERILGLSLDQMMGKNSVDPDWKAIREDGSTFPGTEHPAMVALKTGKSVSNVVMGVHKPNGSLTWLQIHSEPMINPADNKPHAVVTSFTDISEQRNIQRTIKESEERFKKLSNLTFEGIIIHDGSLCIDANISFCKMFGYSLDEIIGINVFSEIILPDFYVQLEEALGKEYTEPIELWARKKDGTEFPVEIEAQDIEWGNEQISVSAIRDISDRLKARQAVEESESRFKMLSELTNEGIVIHEQGRIIDVNQAMLGMTGYSYADFKDADIRRFVPHNLAEKLWKKVEGKITGTYELQVLRKDGTVFPAEVIAKETVINNRSLRVVTIRDLTDKKDKDREIRKLNTAIEQSPVSIYVTSVKGEIEYVNPTFCKVSGYSPEEVLGKNPSILKSGKTTPEKYKDLWETILKGETWNGEFLNKKKDGTLYWERAIITPISDEDNKITNFLAIKDDITEQKVYEEKLKQTLTELARSNKDLEQFAYVSSHDLQEPLRKIKNYAELIAERYASKLDEQGIKYMDIISRGTTRMQMLIDDLLSYSRVSSKGQVFEKVNLNDIMDDVEDNLELAIFRSKAKIVRGDLFEIMGDSSQIYLLFQNLISNALKFKGSKEPLIEIKSFEDIEKKTVAIKDNGIGMDMKYADKIFTVFQRLHSRDEYEGTGIGLAICKKITDRHHGNIWVESEKGKGATFYLSFPKKIEV